MGNRFWNATIFFFPTMADYTNHIDYCFRQSGGEREFRYYKLVGRISVVFLFAYSNHRGHLIIACNFTNHQTIRLVVNNRNRASFIISAFYLVIVRFEPGKIKGKKVMRPVKIP